MELFFSSFATDKRYIRAHIGNFKGELMFRPAFSRPATITSIYTYSYTHGHNKHTHLAPSASSPPPSLFLSPVVVNSMKKRERKKRVELTHTSKVVVNDIGGGSNDGDAVRAIGRWSSLTPASMTRPNTSRRGEKKGQIYIYINK